MLTEMRYLYKCKNLYHIPIFLKHKIMQKFQLELFFHIIGIGSASGLFFNETSLYIISDNSNVLYNFDIAGKKLDKISLTKDAALQENIAKKDKADYEAITANGNLLYLFGSGSTDKRNAITVVDMKTKQLSAIDASDLYTVMQSFGEIDAENFNIEAAVNDGEKWYLFNRGNGPAGQNGIFSLDGDINTTTFQIVYNEIKLPKINGKATGFTDAIKVKNKLYFLAAAEASASTYADGAVGGTIVGRIDIDTMEIDFTEIISTTQKFEGITVYKDGGKTIEFLLCEDTDSDVNNSGIYKLILKK